MVTIACRSATWAQELDLLQPELLERLNGALSEADAEARRGHRQGASLHRRRRPARRLTPEPLLFVICRYFVANPRVFRGPFLVSLCELGRMPRTAWPARLAARLPVGVSHGARVSRWRRRTERTEWRKARPGPAVARSPPPRRPRRRPRSPAPGAGRRATATAPRTSPSSRASRPFAGAPACTSARPAPAASTTSSTRWWTTPWTRRSRATATRSRSPCIPTTASRSPTTAAASRSRSTRRRSARRPRW